MNPLGKNRQRSLRKRLLLEIKPLSLYMFILGVFIVIAIFNNMPPR